VKLPEGKPGDLKEDGKPCLAAKHEDKMRQDQLTIGILTHKRYGLVSLELKRRSISIGHHFFESNRRFAMMWDSLNRTPKIANGSTAFRKGPFVASKLAFFQWK
jgi:predicted HD phosphohydrolase